MRIMRVFPRRTSMTPRDELAFVGDPPMEGFRPEADEVHVSCTFTWDADEAVRLFHAWRQYYATVKLGGACFIPMLASPAFIPGMYLRHGVTITSRGCNNQCPWCLAWRREGKISELDIHPGSNIVDNNIFQCSRGHISRVFDMLRTQHQIKFSGGLDSRLLTESIVQDLKSLRIKELFFACDTRGAIKSLRWAARLLQGFTIEQLRCYVMVAYDGETMNEAWERLEVVYALGFMPFAQLYQPPDRYIDYSKRWRKLAKLWSRPALTKAIHRTGG